MCGIAGIYAFNKAAEAYKSYLNSAVTSLNKRGPDNQGVYFHQSVGLGHTRLSIIDVSEAANQPMSDETGRYTIIYNGEIYNYQEIRKELEKEGISFKTNSDTEVVLKLCIKEGSDAIVQLNGFFAFAIYDKEEQTILLARDRIGIKPLLYYHDNEKLVFASEMKALLSFPVPREIDNVSLYQYLQLTYIPAPASIFKNIRKLAPGHYMYIKGEKVQQKQYYKIPYSAEKEYPELDYPAQQKKLKELLDVSVKKRLISDVPLGAFLSGGIDSSVVVALASRHTKQLNTFSIGYINEPLFDETKYANLVAKKFNTNHTVFPLSTNDLYDHLNDVLDYVDEPFADSSALPVYILSKLTRKHVKVALSGDGGDELFAGYNKHRAEYIVRHKDIKTQLLKNLSFLWNVLPKSRNTSITNKIRQYHRFVKGMNLSFQERYWQWCSFADEKASANLIHGSISKEEYTGRKETILRNITGSGDINELLYTDAHLVLPNDMLHKVDSMSMANSLEVRVPLLDHHVVNYLFSLPSDSKIDANNQKKLLRDTFKDILPSELYNRSKHGFEVPLLNWFKTDLKSKILDDWLSDDFIRDQAIFNLQEIKKIKKQLFSFNPGDVQVDVWKLIIFQNFYKKYLS